MPGATLTTVQSILKEMYEGTVNNQLNEEAVCIKRLEQTAEGVEDNIGGKYVVFPVRNKRNAGISYRGEGAQLADAGQQGYAKAQETLRYGYGRFRITGQAMSLAETKPQTFMSALDGEMDGLKSDLVKDSNRIAWGHKDAPTKTTGILAKLSALAGATITVDQPRTIDVDAIIDIINGTTGAVRGSATVLDVNYDTGVVTLSAAVAATAINDYVSRTGNYGFEPFGLLSLIGNTGTVHGIDSSLAGNKYWQSTVDTATTTLTEQAMLTVCDKQRQAGGGYATAAFCSLGVRRAYYNIMLAQRRFIEPKMFDGGLIGLSFNHGKEIPLVEDPDAPSKTLAFVNEKEIKVFRDKDWFFEDADGAILKWKDGFDEFQGLMKKYWQLGTHKRNSHSLMTNITEPVA